MRYIAFLLKKLRIPLLIYIVCLVLFYMAYIKWLDDLEFSAFILPLCKTALWLVSSYIFFVDISNNMISRLIIGGGTRLGIWSGKAISIMITSLIFVLTHSVFIIIDKGGFSGYGDIITTVSVITVMMAVCLCGITALLCVIIKNMSAVTVILFCYLSNWTFSLMANGFERSDSRFIRENPFYLWLKIVKTSSYKASQIAVCVCTGIVLWFISLLIMQRKELKEENS